MKTDYYIEVEHRVRDLATQYNSDMYRLEQEKQQYKQDRQRSKEIDQKIVNRKHQLLHDLEENATISSEILASGVVDRVTTWWLADLPRKLDAQDAYRLIVAILDENAFKLPDFIENPHWPEQWPPNWFGIDVSFTLVSPWYSKDDRPFHVLDNPVRKDRVFGVPFMSAASWKGLLRWACRMQSGLLKHLKTQKMKMYDWEDPSWIIHLFGNEKGKQKDFRAGALVFYPTWFNKVGFEVINPHSRTRRAGTQPIYYEVVPAGTTGRLQLLYAPLPGKTERDKITPADFIDCFIDSIRTLLETYGISAKRTAGWGTARIDKKESKLYFVKGGCLSSFISNVAETKQYEPPSEVFKKLLDEKGVPISILLDENGKLRSKTQFKKIEVEKPCTNREFEEFKEWWEKNGEEYRRRLNANTATTPLLSIQEVTFEDLLKRCAEVKKGGDQ